MQPLARRQLLCAAALTLVAQSSFASTAQSDYQMPLRRPFTHEPVPHGSGSWTTAAFKAFATMRAGTPLQTSEEAEQAAAAPAGPLQRLRAVFSKQQQHSDDSSEAGPAVWHIEGRLSSPHSGRVIAHVEGVELAQNLALRTDGRRHRQRQQPSGALQSTGSEFCFKSIILHISILLLY
jgi:hypothetical protein